MDLPVYEIELEEGEAQTFTKVSLVKDPAIEQNLILFSKDNPMFFANDEKRIIYCVAMRPNIKIFRNNINDIIDNKGYVFYSEDTVEKFQLQLRKNLNDSKVNINHERDNDADGVYCFENWIVKNPDVDKSKEIGLQTAKGDLVMGFKIDNDAVWNECKAGNLDGLSIEAYFKEPKLKSNFKTEINMNKLEKVTAFFKELFADEVPETEEEKAKRLEEEAKAKEEMAEDPATPPADAPDEEKAMLLEENAKLKEQIVELETKIANWEAEKVKDDAVLETMKAEKEQAVKALEKFKNETPAAEPAKNLPTEMKADKSYEQMSAYEKFREHNKKFKK